MNPNGALVPTVAAVSRAPASVRWNQQQQQQLVRWQRTLLLLLRRCRRSPDTRRRSGGGGRKGSAAWGDMVSTTNPPFCISPSFSAYFPPPLHFDSGSCQLVSKSLATAVQRARMVNVLSLRRDFKRFFQGT